MTERHVPLSVCTGGRRKRFDWWLKGQRERLALWLAPWLRPAPLNDEPLGWALNDAKPGETVWVDLESPLAAAERILREAE